MVIPSSARADHGIEHLLDHLRIERRGRLIEEHDFRLHAECARDGDTLLLPTRELGGILVCLIKDLNAIK